MHLTLCGFNHKSASLDEREPFQMAGRDLREATRIYKEQTGCLEAVAVATCQRVEFYRVSAEKKDPVQEVVEFYQQRGLPATEKLPRLLYHKQETTAARHLFRVAAGLDSLVLGEDQILHQLKEAYSSACTVDGPGQILHKLFHLAFQVGKRVRSETSLGTGPRSLPGAALELLKERWQGRKPRAALVCGVNEITEIILEGLHRWSVPALVASRTFAKAEKLAAGFNAQAITLDRLADVVNKVETIFSATSAPEWIITARHFNNFKPGQFPLYLIDLAIPRDVDPALGDREGLVLFDLEDLQRYLEHCDDLRKNDLPAADTFIEEQVKIYSAWRAKEKQTTKLLHLHRELNKLRKAELERFKEGFHLSEYRALEAFSQALVRQFMKLVPGALDEGDMEEKTTPRP